VEYFLTKESACTVCQGD